jgi:hypothetical protein
MRGAIILLLISFFYNVFSQERNGENFQKNYQLHVKKTTNIINIDGEINELAWQQAQVATSFWQKYPNDKNKAIQQTEVRTLYDDNYLYISFKAYDSGKVFIQSLKRDIGHDGSDGVAVILDPINTRNNGFFFVVNAFNAQSEDQLSSTTENLSWSWDHTWFSETKRHAGYWTAEMAIPFKSIRYDATKKVWGINFLRVDTKNNEYATWTNVPYNFRSHDLGYTGALIWDEAPPTQSDNKVLTPYITSEIIQPQGGNSNIQTKPNAGFDAKIGLNSSLNLDLTVNPDFSQVDVDRQVTNLTRFNIFFPERRTFFLENADLFSGFGIDPIRPFYSRRIGLDQDGNKIPILFGARVTGNLAKKTRIGFMNMQTGRQGAYAPENYTAASVDQRVFKRSVIKGYFLNRQSFMTDAEKKANPLNEYGRNAGMEFNYSNLAGTWQAWGTYHHSFKPGFTTNNQYMNAGFAHSGRNLELVVDVGSLGTNYYADMGFIERILNYDAARDTLIRLGFKQLYTNASYRIIPKKGKIIAYQIEAEDFLVLNPDGKFNERNTNLSFNSQFRNTSSFNIEFANNEVELLFPISFTNSTPIPVGHYLFNSISGNYRTDFRKPFSFFFNGGYGGFYNGTNTTIRAGFTIRKLPNLNLDLSLQYNNLVFPDPYGSAELFLISQRTEINFSTKIFWTTFLQYNTQRNNININSRLQYRFKPMSDLFLVYTDNYFTDPLFKSRSRAFVFKLNYWFNL